MRRTVLSFPDTMPLSNRSKILGSSPKLNTEVNYLHSIYPLQLFYPFPVSYVFGFLEGPSLSPLDCLEVTCLGLETGWILTVDLVVTGSFLVGIGGGSNSNFDFDTDLDPLSKFGGVDSAQSFSKSSSSMGGITSFAFRRLGGLEANCGGAGHLGC